MAGEGTLAGALYVTEVVVTFVKVPQVLPLPALKGDRIHGGGGVILHAGCKGLSPDSASNIRCCRRHTHRNRWGGSAPRSTESDHLHDPLPGLERRGSAVAARGSDHLIFGDIPIRRGQQSLGEAAARTAS